MVKIARVLPALILLLATACFVPPMQVSTAVDAQDAGRVQPGRSVAILLDPEAPSPVLSRELAVEIGELLEERGYRPAPAKSAELFILFGFGTEEFDPSTYYHHIDMAALDAVEFREADKAVVLWKGLAVLQDQAKNPANPMKTLQTSINMLVDSFGRNSSKTIGTFVSRWEFSERVTRASSRGMTGSPADEFMERLRQATQSADDEVKALPTPKR